MDSEISLELATLRKSIEALVEKQDEANAINRGLIAALRSLTRELVDTEHPSDVRLA
jgi:hypothetical protein